jgi:hypothetical protein
VVVAVTFGRGLDARLDARLDDIPNLSSEVRVEVEAQEPDLAAAEPPAEIDAELSNQLDAAIDGAFVDGFRLAMVVGAVMSLLAAAAAWLLIEEKPAAPA